MIASNRKPPKLTSLVEIAPNRGFVGLALDGADLEAAIGSATDVKLLEQAVEIARRNDEKIWAEQFARRAFEIDPDRASRSRLRLASILAAAGRCEEAERLLGGFRADPNDEQYREVRGVLYAKAGQAKRAMEIFDASPGRLSKYHPAPIVLSTAHEMLEQCTPAQMEPLLARLVEEYPAHLLIRSQYLRFQLLAGNLEAARELAQSAEDESAINRAPTHDRRALIEAAAESLELPGWANQLFDFVRERIAQDPAHWSLYDRAARAARSACREKEYTGIVEAIPPAERKKAAALTILCRWHIDENRLEDASRVLDELRPLSASLFLQSRLDLNLHGHDQNQIDAAFDDCIRCRIAPLGPTVSYVIHTYYYNCSPARLRNCLAKLEALTAPAPINVFFWQSYLRCLIAIGEEDRARQAYVSLSPGLAGGAALKPFSMFFDVKENRHDKARKDWTGYIRATRHLSVNAPSSYPRTVRLAYSETSGAVLVFVTLFNAGDFIDAFLAHYRALGVDHFFVVDNGSSDGSVERLCEEADVSVFSNRESFARSAFGVLWVNHLMQRFGIGHWCFHVDIDEHFVFPDCNGGRTLHDLLSYCEEEGFDCVSAIELDMYPEYLESIADLDPFAASCYFDLDYVITAAELPPYVMIQGGLRRRLTGLALSMHKSPLIRVAPDVRYIECNHSTTHLPVADVSGALLHYKFVGDIKRRMELAIARGEHFAGAISYRRLKKAVVSTGSGGAPLVSSHSRRYDGPGALLRHGLIKSSSRWDAYRMQHSGKKASADARMD